MQASATKVEWHLRIEPTGAKSWIIRYYWRGKRVRLSLGTYPEISQRGAHEAASHARKLLEDGIDPRRAERPSAKRRLISVPKDGKAAPANRHSIENLAEEIQLCSELVGHAGAWTRASLIRP